MANLVVKVDGIEQRTMTNSYRCWAVGQSDRHTYEKIEVEMEYPSAFVSHPVILRMIASDLIRRAVELERT